MPPRDWSRDWPIILEGFDGGWHRHKGDAASTVVEGDLPGLRIVAKRPAVGSFGKRLISPVRRGRARRAMDKTLWLIGLGLPIERPILVAERRRGRVLVDQIGLYAAVPGTTLKYTPLAPIEPSVRRAFFTEVGHVMRRTADAGALHVDAKTSNWIVRPIDDGGLAPVLIDADGFERRRSRELPTVGLDRFLRALARQPDATPEDARAVVDAFARPGESAWIDKLRDNPW